LAPTAPVLRSCLHELRAALCGLPLLGVLVSISIFNVYGFDSD
jgi:hypothetical protein